MLSRADLVNSFNVNADLPMNERKALGLFFQYTKIKYTGTPVAMIRHPIPAKQHTQYSISAHRTLQVYHTQPPKLDNFRSRFFMLHCIWSSNVHWMCTEDNNSQVTLWAYVTLKRPAWRGQRPGDHLPVSTGLAYSGTTTKKMEKAT